MLQSEAQAIEKTRGVRFEWDEPIRTAPGLIDEAMQARLRIAAEAEGIPYETMPSGAGHDTAVMSAAGVPSAMIFVTNQNGSHNPHEAMRIDDFLLGVAVLRRALEDFDI